MEIKEQISADIINKIKLFAKELESDNLNISQIFLYGSYARNQKNAPVFDSILLKIS